MTTEQTRALNALNFICGLAMAGVHLSEVLNYVINIHESVEISFKEVYNFIYPEGSDEQEAPQPKDTPCECDL